MMHQRRIAAFTLLVVFGLAVRTAQAQLVVTDPATTARNAAIAVLKRQMLDVLDLQGDRLERMAERLSALTPLDKYALEDVPQWRIHPFTADYYPYAYAYMAALNYGDGGGNGYLGVARPRRQADAAILSRLSPNAREVVARALATLDLADSLIIAGTHQTGALRFNGRRELAAIEALERHVIDPSDAQSATAVLDKVSGAVLIETRQKQARLQLLVALAEQLLVENKRLRDAEAAAMNMQIRRLRDGRQFHAALLAGAAEDLRGWRQP